jgi:preprotein translocase SecE subunit
MASATTENKETKAMATDVIAPGANESPQRPERRAGDKHAFFTIYKKGQGYWTRMGTAAGALAIDVLTSNFLYTQLRAWLHLSRTTALAIATGVFLAIALFAWRMMNKPTSVDFLIATDSEMKKVNWTTRKELIGSTKVVIFFVVLISAILFLIDVAFGFLFYMIRVLDVPPF